MSGFNIAHGFLFTGVVLVLFAAAAGAAYIAALSRHGELYLAAGGVILTFVLGGFLT